MHIDVETTGLEAGYHELIDAGVIVTTIDGDIVDRLFLRMMPDHPERLDPGAAAVNGFSVSRWRSLDALEAAQGARALNAFLLQYSTDHQLIFTAFNVGFDQRFIMHFLKSHNLAFNTFFHYMVLDLPSMAWALGAKSLSGDGISAHFGIPAEVKDPMLHTGETGAAFNVALYQGDVRAVIESPDRIGRSRRKTKTDAQKTGMPRGGAAQLEVGRLCARTPEKESHTRCV